MPREQQQPMGADTLEALRRSIAKWEAIVAGTLPELGALNCPLCRLFLNTSSVCNGCPVKNATGESRCNGTPYDYWIVGMESANSRFASTPELKVLAQAELDFLKSLLPP